MIRLLLILLLLATPALGADNIADIAGWPGNNLPVAAEWAAAHDLKWSVPHIQAGRRLLPHHILPVRKNGNLARWVGGLTAYAEEFAYIHSVRLPLILRHQSNLSSDMASVRGTYPANTAVEWRMKPDGTLDSRPLCDCFAPAAFWSALGTEYGGSLYAAKLQQLCPSPAWIGIWDNNEGGYPNPKAYSRITTGTTRVWLKADELAGISLTMRDRVNVLGYDSDAFEFWPEFFTLRKAQYDSLYAAFHARAWKDVPLRTNAYSAGAMAGPPLPEGVVSAVGFAPEALCYDGAGPSLYPGENMPADLLAPEVSLRLGLNIPAWEWSKARNPAAFRTLFVSIGAKAAQAQSVTPTTFRAWCEWLAWRARPSYGAPVLIQHWIGSGTKPTDAFYGEWTHGDFSIAPALACDSICRDEIRDYWQRGRSVEASTDNPDVRVVACKVDESYLVYAWSPRPLMGNMAVTVDDRKPLTVECPSSGSIYWVFEPPPKVQLVARKVP